VDPLHLSLRFAVALLLGVFVGLEREHSNTPGRESAGVRTFSLIAVAGALAAYLEMEFGWSGIANLAFVCVALLVVVAYVVTSTRGGLGMTTEVAALLVFLVGALAMHGDLSLAASIGVAMSVVLAMRQPLHRLAKIVSRTDIEAILKFAVVTVIILPLLPDHAFDTPPFDALNPHKIWLMVALVGGIDLAGYFLIKALGEQHGIVITGILGGLVSSTALTLNLARRSRSSPKTSTLVAAGILLSWAIMFVRVLVVVAILAGSWIPIVAAQILPPALVCVAAAAWCWHRHHDAGKDKVGVGPNPFELTQALRFGLLFALVSLAARAAQIYLGAPGVYLAGVLAGSVDVDAITITMTGQASGEPEMVQVAARTITIAALSNTAAKTALALKYGAPPLRRTILAVAAIVILAGLLAMGFLGGAAARLGNA
jgi:uncharacterized membrane protein (DUF4010 family)